MEQSANDGRHQNTRRITAVLDCIAGQPERGARMVDISRETGLGKGTLHRILAGLRESGLVEQEAETGRFFIGMRVMNWAVAGRHRFGLTERLKPTLRRICDACGDTVYLTVRVGDESIYVDRREGTYPLKALPVEVGARRPLGVGAAPLAILAFQPAAEIERIVATYEADRLAFGIDEALLLSLIRRAQDLGFSLHQGEVLPGMVAVGVPVYGSSDRPIAAISVAAGAARLPEARRAEVVGIVREAIDASPVVD